MTETKQYSVVLDFPRGRTSRLAEPYGAFILKKCFDVKGPAPIDGYIVQVIHKTTSVSLPDGSDLETSGDIESLTKGMVRHSTKSYIEAFAVTDGQSVHCDSFQNGPILEYDDDRYPMTFTYDDEEVTKYATSGNIIMKGVIYYLTKSSFEDEAVQGMLWSVDLDSPAAGLPYTSWSPAREAIISGLSESDKQTQVVYVSWTKAIHNKEDSVTTVRSHVHMGAGGDMHQIVFDSVPATRKRPRTAAPPTRRSTRRRAGGGVKYSARRDTRRKTRKGPAPNAQDHAQAILRDLETHDTGSLENVASRGALAGKCPYGRKCTRMNPDHKRLFHNKDKFYRGITEQLLQRAYALWEKDQFLPEDFDKSLGRHMAGDFTDGHGFHYNFLVQLCTNMRHYLTIYPRAFLQAVLIRLEEMSVTGQYFLDQDERPGQPHVLGEHADLVRACISDDYNDLSNTSIYMTLRNDVEDEQ
jgi:hypothetical protein